MPLTVDSLPVDLRVIAHWKAALKTADEVALQDFAKNHKHLNMGFRKGKVSLPVLVARVQVMLDQSRDLSPDFCRLLREATLSRQFICVLSEEAIKHSLPQLADAYGRLNVFAALHLDERESMRKLGYDKIQDWGGSEADDSEQKQAVKDLQKLIPDFLTHIRLLLLDGDSFEKSNVGPRSEKAQKRDVRTEKLITAFRAKRTEYNRLQRKFNEISLEAEDIKAESEARRQDLESSTNNLKLASQQYVALNEKFELHVRDAVARQLDNKLVPWLKRTQTLETAVSTSPKGLQEEAQVLLSRQASVDKKFGLRSQLAQESTACQALQLQLREAMAESIEPLPELSAVAKKLANRIAEIGLILQKNSDVVADKTPATSLFVEKINAARHLDELAGARKGWMYLEELGLLSSSELSVGYALLIEKASQLYLKAGLGDATRLQPALLEGIPLYALQRQLVGGQSCVLLIDGHNVLHKLTDFFGESFEQGIPGAKAQQALIKKITLICDAHKNLTVKLWFDSPMAHDETIQGNFMVHYSGGTGANRADEQIVAYLNYLNLQSSQLFKALVTDDRDEAAKAEDCGALILSPLEFKVILQE